MDGIKLNLRIRDHWLAFWMGVASVVMGVLLIFSLGGESPQLEATYQSLDEALGLMFLVGGAAKLYGLAGLHAKYEAAGSALLGAAFAVTLYSTTVYFPVPVSIVFLGGLTVGHLHRAWALAHKTTTAQDVALDAAKALKADAAALARDRKDTEAELARALKADARERAAELKRNP